MAKQTQFQNHLDEIAQALKVQNRKEYTQAFDVIRDYVFNSMCSVSKEFNKLYKGYDLFGSYSNNVRIIYPKEFDVIFKLVPPFNKYINIKEDAARPGFVNLNMENMLDEMENIKGYEDIYNLFCGFIDNEQYLLRSKLHKWLKTVFEKSLAKYGSSINSRGEIFQLTYGKRGVAHNIYAQSSQRTISIDLVPAFHFPPQDWMSLSNDELFCNYSNIWFAVPKPAVGPYKNRRRAFLIANPVAEHELLFNKQNLKVAYRLLKSLVKKKALNRLKSYYLTTAFLWEINEQDDGFWCNPISTIFLHMLDVIAEDFENAEIHFFWKDDLNLLQALTKEEIDEYAEILRDSHNKLSSYEYQPKLRSSTTKNHFSLPS